MTLTISHAVIIGSNGTIGQACVNYLTKYHPTATIHAVARQSPNLSQPGVHYHTVNYQDECSLEACAKHINTHGPLDLVITTIGMLHNDTLRPEKSLKEINSAHFEQLFLINTILPALMAKHFIPLLKKQTRSIFAALSARVGSISDNQSGGWYAYRASKAALNMVLKSAAIETRRLNKQAIIIGLHPGTVESALSEPFIKNQDKFTTFTPEQAATQLFEVIFGLDEKANGRCFAWDGKEILP